MQVKLEPQDVPEELLMQLEDAEPDRILFTEWGRIAGEKGQACSRLLVHYEHHEGRPVTVVFGEGEYQPPDPWMFEGHPDGDSIIHEYLSTIASHGAPMDVITACESICVALNLPKLNRE